MSPAHTTGPFRIRLKESVRGRYRTYGSAQNAYELVIDSRQRPKIKRADKNGELISFWEWLRYGMGARFALVSNQPLITPMLPSLIPLNDQRLRDRDIWHLLAYKLEWRVESSEQFYAYFLRQRPFVTEFDLLAAMAGDIRAEYLASLPKPSAGASYVEPLTQATMDEFLIPNLNQRLAKMGIKLRRFYPPVLQERPAASLHPSDPQGILAALLNLRPVSTHSQAADAEMADTQTLIVAGLLSHFCQGAGLANPWLEYVLHCSGFAITMEEIGAALNSSTSPSSALVVQRLKEAGRTRLRAANRTTAPEAQRRTQLRRKALAFLELAHLLNDSPLVAQPNDNGSEQPANQSQHLELLTLIHSLRESDHKQTARIAFEPGSTVHLLAVAAEVVAPGDAPAAAEPETLQLVREILPLTVGSLEPLREPVEVWTPAAAAKQLDFAGAATEFDLMLQVLEPAPAPLLEASPRPTGEAAASVLFWRWKVRAHGDRFAVRLRPSALPALYEVEVQEAEFTAAFPQRSTEFPPLPHFHLKHEPLELALLIDGYWLAAEGSATSEQRTGLELLTDLLDELDALENVTKRGLLFHAAICLDTHLSQEFQAAYGSIPSLYTLEAAPIETSAQLVAEWLQPWVERWNEWEIKPYAVDTDISLEKGLYYLRHLRWQQTSDPMQRAILVIGRSRPHDHANHFTGTLHQSVLDTAGDPGPLEIPYHAEDRFSVTDIDWREEVAAIRQSAATLLALCDPGLSNARYQLPANHPLYLQYRRFWATIDPGTLLDVDDRDGLQHAGCGADRVLERLEQELFQRRAVRYCAPQLALPFSQILPVLSSG